MPSSMTNTTETSKSNDANQMIFNQFIESMVKLAFQFSENQYDYNKKKEMFENSNILLTFNKLLDIYSISPYYKQLYQRELLDAISFLYERPLLSTYLDRLKQALNNPNHKTNSVSESEPLEYRYTGSDQTVNDFLQVCDYQTLFNEFVNKLYFIYLNMRNIKEINEASFIQEITLNVKVDYIKLSSEFIKSVHAAFIGALENGAPFKVSNGLISFDLVGFLNTFNKLLHPLTKRHFVYLGGSTQIDQDLELYEFQCFINALMETHVKLANWWSKNKEAVKTNSLSVAAIAEFEQSDFYKRVKNHSFFREYSREAILEFFRSAFMISDDFNIKYFYSYFYIKLEQQLRFFTTNKVKPYTGNDPQVLALRKNPDDFESTEIESAVVIELSKQLQSQLDNKSKPSNLSGTKPKALASSPIQPLCDNTLKPLRNTSEANTKTLTPTQTVRDTTPKPLANPSIAKPKTPASPPIQSVPNTEPQPLTSPSVTEPKTVVSLIQSDNTSKTSAHSSVPIIKNTSDQTTLDKEKPTISDPNQALSSVKRSVSNFKLDPTNTRILYEAMEEAIKNLSRFVQSEGKENKLHQLARNFKLNSQQKNWDIALDTLKTFIRTASTPRNDYFFNFFKTQYGQTRSQLAFEGYLKKHAGHMMNTLLEQVTVLKCIREPINGTPSIISNCGQGSS